MSTARKVGCCVAGCGPARAVLGLLLARAGVPVVVLEKHADFLRDFRGDTIHPATLETLDDLGLADRFLKQLPHSRVSRLDMRTAAGMRLSVDFSRLPSRFKFIAFVPQWDFLEFITREARRYPTFTLMLQVEARELLVEDGTVIGVRFEGAAGNGEIRAALTVGADGRTSRVREAAGLPLLGTSPPMDVLWFRVSRRPTDTDAAELRLAPARFFVLINRRDYWQVAYVIPKGAYAQVRAAGLDAFRRTFAEGVPEVADRADEIRDWEQVKLLTVRADRLRRWYRPGLLCIGDAAHAMSPIAGVGINVAIQDQCGLPSAAAGARGQASAAPGRAGRGRATTVYALGPARAGAARSATAADRAGAADAARADARRTLRFAAAQAPLKRRRDAGHGRRRDSQAAPRLAA